MLSEKVLYYSSVRFPPLLGRKGEGLDQEFCKQGLRDPWLCVCVSEPGLGQGLVLELLPFGAILKAGSSNILEPVFRAPFVAGSCSKCSSPGEGSDLFRLVLSQVVAVAGPDWGWGRFSRELEISKDRCSGKQGSTFAKLKCSL